MKTDALIESLVTQGAKKPLLSPKILTAIWAVMLFGCASVLVIIYGLREDMATKLIQPLFYVELFSVLALAIVAIAATSWFSLPDNQSQKWVRVVPILAGIILFSWLIISVITASSMTLSECLKLGRFYCVYRIIGGSILPSIILFTYLRKATTIHYYWASGMVGLATASASYVAMRLIEPFDDPFILFTWLFIPMVIVIFSCLLVGRFVLTQPQNV